MKSSTFRAGLKMSYLVVVSIERISPMIRLFELCSSSDYVSG